MVRKLAQMTAFAVLGGIVLVQTTGVTAADKKEIPSIEDIMSKGHAGGKSLMKGIDKDAADGKWDAAAAKAKIFAGFGEALGQNKAPQGDAASWKKLTEKYKASTKAVEDAVKKKDAKSVADALEKMGPKSGACKECHDIHKE